MIELRWLATVREAPRNAWDALVQRDASPFVEWTWLDCLEESRCVGPGTGWLPHHIAIFDNGKLVSAAPAYLKGDSNGEFVFDWAWADLADQLGIAYYPKLVIGVPFTPVAGQRLLVAPGYDAAALVGAVADAIRTLCDRADLSGAHVLFPREAEAACWNAHGFETRFGYQYQWRNAGFSCFDDFLKTVPTKKRTQFRREMAQPAKDGVRIETLDAASLTDGLIATMYTYYASTVSKYAYGQRYLNERFFQLVAERFASRLAWVFAHRGETPIAGAFNVEHGNRLYGRYWGADDELPFLHFNLCYYHGIERAIERKLDVFEPGAGGEHKRARGFAPTITYSNHWIVNATLRSVLFDFVRRERSAVEQYVTNP